MFSEVESEARRRIRKHGDLSAMVEAAVASAEFGNASFPPKHGPSSGSTDALTSVYLPVETRKRVRELAAQYGTSDNEIMNAALMQHFNKTAPPG